MDLRHIPSLRRNQIISDVFARLHLMERRGSGIGRILSGYAEFDRQPEFFSDPDFFIVTLPNKGFPAEESQVKTRESQVYAEESQVKTGESQVYAEESQIKTGESQVLNGDMLTMEMEEFQIRIKSAMGPMKKRTLSCVMEMFRRYGYNYSFNRNNVADSFGVTTAYASAIISRMQKAGLMKKAGRGVYYFTK